MKQVGHAFNIVPLIGQNNYEDDVKNMIKAQLSHSDGIRGFFVSYLTGDGETVADDENVPQVLLDAMDSIETDELISLACMNVIMPVAMTSMHEDVELSASSAKTAKRGIKILKALQDKPGTSQQCNAIYDVATGNVENKEDQKDIKVSEMNEKFSKTCLVITVLIIPSTDPCYHKHKYWIQFFDKWGYKEKQKEDIQNVMAEILSK